MALHDIEQLFDPFGHETLQGLGLLDPRLDIGRGDRAEGEALLGHVAAAQHVIVVIGAERRGQQRVEIVIALANQLGDQPRNAQYRRAPESMRRPEHRKGPAARVPVLDRDPGMVLLRLNLRLTARIERQPPAGSRGMVHLKRRLAIERVEPIVERFELAPLDGGKIVRGKARKPLGQRRVGAFDQQLFGVTFVEPVGEEQ